MIETFDKQRLAGLTLILDIGQLSPFVVPQFNCFSIN